MFKGVSTAASWGSVFLLLVVDGLPKTAWWFRPGHKMLFQQALVFEWTKHEASGKALTSNPTNILALSLKMDCMVANQLKWALLFLIERGEMKTELYQRCFSGCH